MGSGSDEGPFRPAFIHAPQMWLKIYKPTLVDLFLVRTTNARNDFLLLSFCGRFRSSLNHLSITKLMLWLKLDHPSIIRWI